MWKNFLFVNVHAFKSALKFYFLSPHGCKQFLITASIYVTLLLKNVFLQKFFSKYISRSMNVRMGEKSFYERGIVNLGGTKIYH